MAYHTRSISFPSLSNTIVSQIEEQLSRLASSEFASSSTISSKLTHLSDLYEAIDELLQLPSSQKAISSQGQKKSTEGALEKSIKFLDICSAISDVLVQMKERAQQVQSILRRRGSEFDVSKEAAHYLRSRKNAIKSVMKALKELKKINTVVVECNDVVMKLRECQMVTLNVLESVLVAIAGNKCRSNWESVVSKMMKAKRVEQQTEFLLVEFEASDAVLYPEEVRSSLEKMEISIKGVEQGSEILFRHLIKTRTTILNILNC